MRKPFGFWDQNKSWCCCFLTSLTLCIPLTCTNCSNCCFQLGATESCLLNQPLRLSLWWTQWNNPLLCHSGHMHICITEFCKYSLYGLFLCNLFFLLTSGVYCLLKKQIKSKNKYRFFWIPLFPHSGHQYLQAWCWTEFLPGSWSSRLVNAQRRG